MNVDIIHFVTVHLQEDVPTGARLCLTAMYERVGYRVSSELADRIFFRRREENLVPRMPALACALGSIGAR